MRRFLSFFFVCAILPIAHSSCPDGFELAVDGQCNQLVASQIQLPFNIATETAISKCKGYHAEPVIIHNQEQHEYWTGRINHAELILGIVCNTVTSQWEWSDGSSVDYKPAKGNYDSPLDEKCKTGCTWYIWSSRGEWSLNCVTYTAYFDIYCTTQLPPLPVPSTDGCERFEDDSEDGVCYQVGGNAENWQAAQMSCQNSGGNLASIHSLQENSFIRRLAVSKGAVDGLFLGATISGKGKEFGWIDGSEWDYEYFYPSFPLDGQGDCLAMDTLGITGQWVNKNCSASMPFACVNRQSHSAPVCSGPWKEGQIITSPGYPFDASTPCEFILTVEAGKNVELEVVLLEANSCCDHLILTDDFVGGTIIANLTGEISNKIYATKSSNLMRVSWQPNGGVNVRGMMMTFRGV